MKSIIISLALCFTFNLLIAQGIESLPDLNGNLNDWYSSVNDLSSPIMKGTYFYYTQEQMVTQDQNPFYKQGWDQLGSITFEGRTYSNMNMVYNTSEDVLLIWSWDMRLEGIKSLLIDQTKIDAFIIHKDRFLSEKHANVGRPGFYRVIVEGENLALYAKEEKRGSLEGMYYEFEENRQYYLRYNERTFKYNRKSSLYRIFPEYKKQIRKYINTSFSSWKKGDERLLKATLTYCDSIVK
ncbi:hypothetical protein [Ekhidna sp.]|uniref:hypothetical protein n=1 Tax=Ekhidna sp. TaxID=2608089 RepID=UPI003CCBCC4D